MRWVDAKIAHLRRFSLVGMTSAADPMTDLGTSSDGTSSSPSP
jgi:hypothetical protein